MARNGYANGTIGANGTLSDEIDLGESGALEIGLIALSNAANGTLSWQVSHKADADGGHYVDLRNASGIITAGPFSRRFAVSSDVLSPIRPFRYVKLKWTAAGNNVGFQFLLVTKD